MVIHEASLRIHLMMQANEGQRMFVRMRGWYRHKALETKDVGGNASSDIGVAQDDEQTSKQKWVLRNSIN